MNVKFLEAFSDNYIWMIEEGDAVIVVDPGEAAGVLAYLKKEHRTLDAILLTHKHDDHIGGVGEILADYPTTPIYGPKETNQLASHMLQEGDFFERLGIHFDVLKTAGHSEEHISYVTDGALFCGDALFSAGCGRVFTGDYQAQFEALKKFEQLDDTIQVFAGHEYTQTNLRFAQSVQPENKQLAEALEEANQLQSQGKPTLPSTIGKEKEINLFMQAETIEEFRKLRNARDNF